MSDLALPGALWLAVARSDIPHGHIGGIDTRMAEEAPGVVAVLTAADLGEVPRIPIRVGPTPRLLARLQPVIAGERVRYVGEPVAVVVAETAAQAEYAAGLVFPDIAPLEVASAPGDVGWSELDADVLVDVAAAEGDLQAAFAGGVTVVEGTFRTARKTGLPIEPRGLAARWEAGRLEVWGVTKFIDFTRRTLAEMLGVEADSVVCHRVDVGGMFGVRGEFYPEDFLVPWAARRLGRAVRWAEPRRQHLMAINHAGGQWHRARIALDGGGRPVALEADVVVDAGAYPRPIGSRIAHIVAETMAGPYRWDAWAVRCRTVATHRAPTGTVRGPAAYETTFVRERILDMAARRGGHDPVAVRRSGLIAPEAIPFARSAPEGHEVIFDGGDFPAVFEYVLEHIGYDEWVAERDRRRRRGEVVGIGLGPFVIHSALGGDETVSVELDTEGRFLVRTSTCDVGQGLDRMAARVLADGLGIAGEDVAVQSGDTGHEGGRGTYSSRTTVFVANALADAAASMLGEARAQAAEMLGCSADDVTFSPAGPEAAGTSLLWKEIAPLGVVGSFTMERPTYGFGLHVSLVSVDPETGVVTPERMAVAYDCGRALSRDDVADQLRGGAVAGLGAALFERLDYSEDGNPLTTTLADYLIPSGRDVPVIDVLVVEAEPAPGNPLGLRGVGEAGVIGAGAALANAVADALGPEADALVRSLPIDREAISLSAVGAAG